MAKKKRESASQDNRNSEAVIDQLFGTPESDTEIESDIAGLGTEQEQETAAEGRPAGRFFFVFAIFVIIMAVIGCFSTVRFAVDCTGRLMDNTSLKNEFAQFIFPVVINDIPTFDNTSELRNTAMLNSAIWNILINKDTTPYENDGMMGLTIPEYDVLASCREIFGSNITLEHQTVGSAEVRFVYDEENHTYSASKNTRYLTYSPVIVDMTESQGIYTLTVGYLPPSVAAVAGISGMETAPEKYMEYTISRWDGKNTLLSVKYSSYTPETSEG